MIMINKDGDQVDVTTDMQIEFYRSRGFELPEEVKPTAPKDKDKK